MDLFGPLLKSPSENPHATLIAPYLNAVQEVHDPKNQERVNSELLAVSRYSWPSDKDREEMTSAASVKLMGAMVKLRDSDALFQKYMIRHDFDRISREAGLVMGIENTVILKWPLRLRANASQEEFDVLMSSGHMGSERYVEWVRAT